MFLVEKALKKERDDCRSVCCHPFLLLCRMFQAWINKGSEPWQPAWWVSITRCKAMEARDGEAQRMNLRVAMVLAGVDEIIGMDVAKLYNRYTGNHGNCIA